MKRIKEMLLTEIGIEFKAALYFYPILFFYMGYELISDRTQLDIFSVVQMIAATYLMGFAQVYLMENFDEAECVTWKEICKAAICSAIYTGAGWLLCWFDRSVPVTIGFFFFMLVCYGCAYWLYSFRRSASTKTLNRELEAYKQRKYNTGGEKNDTGN